MRFDARDREEVSHGMSVGSLELSASDRVAFDSLRRAPHDQLATMLAKKMGARARKLLESASGVCIVSARDNDPSSDVLVGRCMQRAWRALASGDIAAHPMTTIPAMEAMLGVEETGSFADLGGDQTDSILASFRAAFPSVERGARIAFMMRFGWAPPPTVRVGRRALAESVESFEAIEGVVAEPVEQGPSPSDTNETSVPPVPNEGAQTDASALNDRFASEPRSQAV
jgi:hypothetical protein